MARNAPPIAVERSILVILYYLWKERGHYADSGADFFDRLKARTPNRYYVKRLEPLGHSVKLEPCVNA